MLSRVTVIVALAVVSVTTCNPQSGSDRFPPTIDFGEPAPIKLATPEMSSAERREFLSADYRIVRNVSDLPAGIRKLYSPKTGSHVVIADPGDYFNEGDIIVGDLPTRRLIFAGVTPDRAFIHYEKGGIFGPSSFVVLFRLESPDIAVPLWRGCYGRAKNLEEIRLWLGIEDRTSLRVVQQFWSNGGVHWLKVDQLCGRLKSDPPIKETRPTADGKVETQLYPNFLRNAEVELYRGTPSDRSCCKREMHVGGTKSNEQGRFELSGFQRGWYWLRIEQDFSIEGPTFTNTLLLRVTSDFNDKSCRDAAIGQVLTVNTKPPKVETSIH